MCTLRRFWIVFDGSECHDLPGGVRIGVGVSARDEAEALATVSKRVFGRGPSPPIARLIVDVDVSTLDEAHVLPNMLPPTSPGVWFPLGYR